MRKILIAIDGSPQSEGAASHIAGRTAPGDSEIHLVNVQRPLSAYAARFLTAGLRRDFHRERGRLALTAAETALRRSGHRVISHIHVGEPGDTVGRAANALGVDEIVVGADGLGPLGRYMFRSFMARLMRRAEAPVVVIKSAMPARRAAASPMPQPYPAPVLDERLALRR